MACWLWVQEELWQEMSVKEASAKEAQQVGTVLCPPHSLTRRPAASCPVKSRGSLSWVLTAGAFAVAVVCEQAQKRNKKARKKQKEEEKKAQDKQDKDTTNTLPAGLGSQDNGGASQSRSGAGVSGQGVGSSGEDDTDHRDAVRTHTHWTGPQELLLSLSRHRRQAARPFAKDLP